MADPVNHPAHYETGGIECFDAIVASQGIDAAMNFCLCNAFKYIWRCQHKGKTVEDIEKAIWYLNKYLDIYPYDNYRVSSFEEQEKADGHV